MTAALDRSVGLLGDLVAFESVSARTNLDLIGYVAAYLGDLGVSVLLSHDDSGEKANLFATVGPEVDGGIVLSGHTDVVPVDGQAWSSPPFEMVRRNGALYGRGTADMKGFIACALAQVPAFLEADLKLPLHLAFTFDEEIGSCGAPVLLDQLEGQPFKPGIAIVGEPTEMQIIAGHKGGYEMTTTIKGLEGHASDPRRGVNAIDYATRYIAHLHDVARELETRAAPESRFDPPWTTISVGRIEGGAARNIIAGHCRIDWELRPVPGDDGAAVIDGIRAFAEEELLSEMRRVDPDAQISTEIAAALPALDYRPESPAVALIRLLTGSNTQDVVPFGSDAGHFQRADISTVLFGPGSIEQAHKPDEFIAVDQLEVCLGFLDRLRDWMVDGEPLR
jgi:acetylornithine deacetylase